MMVMGDDMDDDDDADNDDDDADNDDDGFLWESCVGSYIAFLYRSYTYDDGDGL